LIGAGIGWFLGWLIFSALKNYNLDIRYETYGLTIASAVAICAGIALLIVYLIERKAYKERKKEE
jgi:ABC-type antimicrobial peptide transport system permease subunit